jgi:hypothetical protein
MLQRACCCAGRPDGKYVTDFVALTCQSSPVGLVLSGDAKIVPMNKPPLSCGRGRRRRACKRARLRALSADIRRRAVQH